MSPAATGRAVGFLLVDRCVRVVISGPTNARPSKRLSSDQALPKHCSQWLTGLNLFDLDQAALSGLSFPFLDESRFAVWPIGGG